MNILILLAQAQNNNENLCEVLEELRPLDPKGRKRYIRALKKKKGHKSSESIVNLLHESEKRGLPEEFLLTLAKLGKDASEIYPYQEPVPVMSLPSALRYDLPTTTLTGAISTLEAIRRIFDEAERDVIIVTAFTYSTIGKILGPLIAEATRSGKKVTFITQPANENLDYNPEPALARINGVVRKKGDPDLLHIHEKDLGAEGMMHLKILIADDNLALVGSANMTKSAMKRNIEAGVLVSGKTAAILSRIIRGLTKKDQQISDIRL